MARDLQDMILHQHIDKDYFKPVIRASTTPPVAIISIPKAGTYLASLLLETLGLTDTEIHSGVNGFTDLRERTLEEKRRDSLKLFVEAPLEVYLPWVGPGQFIVGHFPAYPREIAALSSFKRIFCVRNIRDAIVSHMRFMSTPGEAQGQTWCELHDGPEKMLGYFEALSEPVSYMYTAMSGWEKDTKAFCIPFETLMGDKGIDAAVTLVEDLNRFLGLTEIENGPDILRSLIGTDTRTYSGKRTRSHDFWNDDVEMKFHELGLEDLNQALGYPAATTL